MDDRRLTVPPEGPIAAMIGSAGWRRNERLGKAVAKMVRQGCVAHDYLDLIEGRLQFAHFRRLHPWDHAAGVLLHQEAGGYGALIDGTPYRPVPLHNGLLLAPGRASWEQLASLIGE